ncbi:putative bifunctional diguanylate cyclase/phosphodiesterase [Bacillus sp. AK128]
MKHLLPWNFDSHHIVYYTICLFIILTTPIIIRIISQKKLPHIPRKFSIFSTVLFVLLTFTTFFLGQIAHVVFVDKEHEIIESYAKDTGSLIGTELLEFGHEALHFNTNSDDELYQTLLTKMTTWQEKLEIQSIYTLKKNSQDEIYFVVSPPTDYNNDGLINADIEQVIPIGSIYDENIPELKGAFLGDFMMQTVPTVDYGVSSISAFYPIINQYYQVESVLVLNFDGDDYAKRVEEEHLKINILIISLLIIEGLLYSLFYLSSIEKLKLKQHHKELNQLAYFDLLTGLPNRRYVNDVMNIKDHDEIALLFISLDGYFKVIDLLGYGKGEEYISKIINTIKPKIDHYGILVRWGEKDFVVLVPEFSNCDNLLATSQTILKHLPTSIRIGERQFEVTPAIGISIYPKDGNDWSTLIKNADIARFHSKQLTNGNIKFFEEQLLVSIHEKLSFEMDFRKAIEAEQFVVYFQPQIELVSGKWIGLEALVRWNHPEKGLLSPFYFIQLAEELHLIDQLSVWIFEHAFMQIKDLNDELNMNLKISVNLSPTHFKSNTLLSDLQSVVQKSGINPALIDFEITEGALLDFNHSITILNQIKDLGMSISLDDFGAGYSSLSYLSRLPIDRLKIDRQFLQNNDFTNNTLLNSIVNLGHNLNLIVLAEGVETKEHVELLREFGCDEVQGYYYSKPVSLEELKALLLTYEDHS